MKEIWHTIERPNLWINIEEGEGIQVKVIKVFFNKLLEENSLSLKKLILIKVQKF